MRIANCRREIVLCQRGLDPRDEVAVIGLVVGVLKLAAAALGEMAARRLLERMEGNESDPEVLQLVPKLYAVAGETLTPLDNQ